MEYTEPAMQPSPFKNEKILVLLFVGLILGLGITGAIAARVPPSANVMYGSSPSGKPVRVSPFPGSPTIEEPIPTATSESPTNELACTDAGGTWNACGSACRNQPDAKACIQVCVEYCECASDDECPADENNVNRLTCADYVDGVGVCQ